MVVQLEIITLHVLGNAGSVISAMLTFRGCWCTQAGYTSQFVFTLMASQKRVCSS